MKHLGNLVARGLVCQPDGLWRSAVVESDGISIAALDDGEVSELPRFGDEVLAIDMADVSGLAFLQSCKVVSDFRSADEKMGGEGGPLYPAFLLAVGRFLASNDPVLFLEARDRLTVTYVDPTRDDPVDPRALLVFDAGPGPDCAMASTGQTGQVVDGALELFLDDPYFRKLAPKRISSANFTEMLGLVHELAPPDARATLLGMSAMSALLAKEHLPQEPTQIVMLNPIDPIYREMLAGSLDASILDLDDVGLNADAFQAQAIAYLAIRVIKGLPTTFPNTTGVAAALGGASITEFS